MSAFEIFLLQLRNRGEKIQIDCTDNQYNFIIGDWMYFGGSYSSEDVHREIPASYWQYIGRKEALKQVRDLVAK